MAFEKRFFVSEEQHAEMNVAFKEVWERAISSLSPYHKFFRLSLVEEKKSTRYKYYFGHVVPIILQSGIITSLDPENIVTIEDVHEILKVIYNSQEVGMKIKGQGRIFVITHSTTKLSDQHFSNNYVDKIVADFTVEHGLDFMPREEWADMMSLKH